MPRKAYIADLAKATGFHGVHSIHDLAGSQDDGEFHFLFMNQSLVNPIALTARITEISDYPSCHAFILFAADDTPDSIAQLLASHLTMERTLGRSIVQLLCIVADTLSKHLGGDEAHILSGAGGGDDHAALEEEDSDEMEEEDELWEYLSQSDDLEALTTQNYVPALPSRPGFSSDEAFFAFTSRIRADLRAAKEAGFKVGHHGKLLQGNGGFVILSIKMSKLGISEPAMQAWQVEPSEYLNLIIKYHVYKTLEQQLSSEERGLRCRRPIMAVRTSKVYKPSYEQCLAAFQNSQKNGASTLHSRPKDAENHPNSFRPIFLSKSLEALLDERLLSVLEFRGIGLSREGAERFYADNLGSGPLNSKLIKDVYFQLEACDESYPAILKADHWLDKRSEGSSFPLLAMQMLLQHFVRCTEFCVVCHRKLDTELEAIKPYVCDNGLCLYQYVSMGFGPSLEHEIMAQPYTCDLLISFAYAQAAAGALTTFPHGFDMLINPSMAQSIPKNAQYPVNAYADRNKNPITLNNFTTGMKVKFDHNARLLLLGSAKDASALEEGKWIAIMEEPDCRLIHCRINSIHDLTVRLGPLNGHDPENKTAEAHSAALQFVDDGDCFMNPAKPSWTTGWVETYSVHFHDLDEDKKCGTIKGLLDTLPSVKHIRDHLVKQATPDLTFLHRTVPPAALGLLRWIVASNRACILQLFDMDEDSGKPVPSEGRVHGMEEWMQFRFAMGAPDKEQRFLKCVRETQSRLGLQHPTMFAFHGSRLRNWHSIIREGLHYNNIVNGRSYGNGVYHSLDLNTSLGYSTLRGGDMSWPNSVLQIKTALALNEIVNAPKEFTSQSPHLVIQDVDWIQTRYLFVKCSDAAMMPPDGHQPWSQRSQDPTVTPRNSHAKLLIIPDTTMKKTKKRVSDVFDSIPTKFKKFKTPKKPKSIGKGTAVDPMVLDDEDSFYKNDYLSDATDIEDLELLIEDETLTPPHSPSSPLTNFIPGETDHSTLHIMPMPGYANVMATQRLQKDFRDLLKVQDITPLHERGWYIDPSKFDCPYHWIVELHSFHMLQDDSQELPLAKDMEKAGVKSIILELRFPASYPMSPPFVRIIRPRFLSFMNGGGGHVTAGGAICMQLLTNSGWSSVLSIEAVLVMIRTTIASTDDGRTARLDLSNKHTCKNEYGVGEAIEAYKRACRAHGWAIPPDFDQMTQTGI